MVKKYLKRGLSILLTLAMITAFIPAMAPMRAYAGESDPAMDVSGVVITAMNISTVPYITTAEVAMPDLELDESAFFIENTTTPGNVATVTNASYGEGKYTLTISGMTLYDNYTLIITNSGYETYTNSDFYGTLATPGDLNLVNEPNVFDTFTRTLTDDGVVTIGNNTYEAGALLYSGTIYDKIDGNNNNPDNGTVTRLIGIFAAPPTGAKGVQTLRPNGVMTKVETDSLIDSNPNYQETIRNGKDYYDNEISKNPDYVDTNQYWKTLAFLPLYSQIATQRQNDCSRILTDPPDRFRIIAWYGNENCTGFPIKVVRLIVKVDYTGTRTIDAAAPTVSSITPNSGSNEGGTNVTIKGTNFAGASNVTIGGAAATNIKIIDPSTITATTPVGTAGNADVAVTAPGGSDTGNGLFSYTMTSIMTAENSAQLQSYIENQHVSTINLIKDTEYTYDGGIINRALTINGNGATIHVGTGFNDTIVKITGISTVNGTTFLAVQGAGSSLTMRNVTLYDDDTRLLAAINVKDHGTLSLDGVAFRNFFANLNSDPKPAEANAPGSYNNFGVHAEPGAVSTRIINCSFDSSNAFRNAVAIRNGIAVISNNTFVGTGDHQKQNKTDGFEYAVYLYGGTCTVTGNDISGCDSVIDTVLGYHSSGIAAVPYYDIDAAISQNTMRGNSRGIDLSGSWNTYTYPAAAKINGAKITSSANAFQAGESLRTSNTFTGNAGANITLALDQNDHYYDSGNPNPEYGPPAYYDTLLSVQNRSVGSAQLGFDAGTSAQLMIRNQKAFGIEVSEDDGATWKKATLSAELNASSRTAAVTLAAGKTYKLRAVMVIASKVIPYGLEDDQDADITVYSNSVTVTIPASSSGGKGGGGSSQPDSVVEVDGKKQDAGISKSEVIGGKTVTTIKVDDAKLDKILDTKGSNATVTLPAGGSSDVVVGELNGQTVKNMEKKEAVLEIKTRSVTYTLPASQINIDSISAQMGRQIELKDIKVSVRIAELSADTVKIVKDTADKNSYQIVIKPVEFEITCENGSKSIEVSRFNGYVERLVAIPDGIDPLKITTGIVLNADGTFRHAPTQITVINGKYYAKINSLTNSTYSVIYNPIEFADVASHWSKDAVNDMGSRLVVTGVGSDKYDPNRSITRAEFAAIVVRALGLAQGTTESSFGDVTLKDWFNGYVDTATEYDIIKGYDNASFKPNEKITREQAMAILARSMKSTGLSASLSDSEISGLLAKYSDGTAISDYARGSVAACIKTGVVTGASAVSIAPKAYVTRAEVAAMVQRLLKKSDLI